MGLLGDVGQKLFGHQASDPNEIKQGYWGAYDDYMRYLNAAYGNDAVRGQIGNFTGDYDRNLLNQRGSATVAAGTRGFRETPSFMRQRTSDVSRFAAGARQNARLGMLNGQTTRMGMLDRMRPVFHRNASGGLMGAIAPLAEAYGQYAAMGKQYPVGNDMPSQGGFGGVNPYGGGNDADWQAYLAYLNGGY